MPRKNRVDETNINTQGLQMTIIAYRACDDIDVKFASGAIVRHRLYRDFASGKIRDPKNQYTKHKKDRADETSIGRNGMKMKIIVYRTARDIDVEFEDGAVVYHKNYSNFKKGYIQHPNISKNTSTAQTKLKVNADARVDEQVVNKKTGELMTLIAYHNAFSVDIQFPDGTVVNRHYYAFQHGAVSKQSLPKESWDKTGQSRYSDAGIKMTIIKYIDAKHVDTQFEDGTIVTGIPYGQFNGGSVLHPKFRKGGIHNKWQIGDYNISGLAYKHMDGSGEFFCTHLPSGAEDIKTVQEILQEGKENAIMDISVS